MLSIRKIGVVGRTYRHLARYRQILMVFFKYGFGDLIELLKIEQYIEIGLQLISKNRRSRLEKLSRAERVRMACEELGPTYIKMGQILSTRPDLVPVDFIKELSKLQDNVPAGPFSEVSKIIESELGAPPDEIFDFFEKTPLASASIGQVYRATLKDGEAVAVKVQRPGIKKVIEVDLEIMLHLATLMEHHIEEMSLHQPVKIVEEFARTLEREIDYTIEATNMERIASNFLNDLTIYVPKVFRDTTTESILTTEFVDGIKVSEIHRLEEAGLDRRLITSRGADIVLKQIIKHGFFHADPHPGNIFVLPDNVICLLDFGMTGSIDRRTREDFIDLAESVVKRNESRATQVLLRLTYRDEDPDIRLLEKDVADFMGRHLYKPLKDIKIGKLMNNLLELAFQHRLRIPPDIFLMLKAFGAIEGVGLMLDPDFDMIKQAAPFIKEVKLDRMSPQRIAGDVFRLGMELFQFVENFPKDILSITRLIKQQKFSLNLEYKGLDKMLSTYDQISNRISFSIIIAALIIGSAIVIMSKVPPLFYDISLIGIVGFLAAAIMGIWLLVAILRKGRL
jgi:ubiquinone biosynthesis protein